MTASQLVPSGHIVAVALPMWGHTKSLCSFVVRIIKLRRTHVTLFTDVMNREKVLEEVSSLFDGATGPENMQNLVRVVALPSDSVPYQFDLYKSAFVEAYRTLLSETSIAIAPNSDSVYEPVPKPNLVIVDFFCYEILRGIRSISGTEVPVYAWQSGSATAVLYLCGPETFGGKGDLAEKFSKVTAEDANAREKVIEMVFQGSDQKLVVLPGLPPMYEHEHMPQIRAIPISMDKAAAFLQYNHRFLVECDGVIHATSKLFEGDALGKWQEWYGSRAVLTVGPISPPASAEGIARERSKSAVGQEVEVFLNASLDKFGPNSVVYISFGTVWWSSQPEKIWTFIDTLLELDIPFLMSHASHVATVPEHVAIKVKASGLGYLSKWLPQQMILRHKACGWFVTHCGHNSVMESLSEGVPLICWPFDADQPTNAANIVSVHGAGYELFEVRTGQGLLPIHRLGDNVPIGTLDAVRQEAVDVLTKARGKDGEIKREKAQWFMEQFAKSWTEGGQAWIDMKKLVDGL
ncbi:hypothetical protein ACEPAF_6092 [Sanghuangporus sanghuang]